MMIQSITVDDLERAPNFTGMLEAYGVESSIDGMPPYNAQMASYKQLEAAGLLHVLGSFTDETLTGFLCLMVSTLPHYGVMVATTESFFVASEHRKSGAGTMLLKQAEYLAREKGAAGLFVSAPKGGRLAQVMESAPRYRETNRVFFRSLADD